MCCGKKFDDKWKCQDCEKTGKDDVNVCLRKESFCKDREKILQCDVAELEVKILNGSNLQTPKIQVEVVMTRSDVRSKM